jgi:hypothetical protein
MFVAHLASTGHAVGQVGPPDSDTYQRMDSAPLVDFAAYLSSTVWSIQDVPAIGARKPGPYGRPFLAALVAVPLVTYVGPLAPRPSDVVFPADRFVIAELIGGGYVVNPRFRFGVMGVFSEALTGLPTGAATWQLGGVAPLAIGTFNHFIVSGGPIIGYRSGGKVQSSAPHSRLYQGAPAGRQADVVRFTRAPNSASRPLLRESDRPGEKIASPTWVLGSFVWLALHLFNN